ncbi:MAG: hypothetical protein FJ271_04185 [Planctomycetes bacterium]|nr:hypothetical protein [Planctomycetota bacterium]
MRMLPRVLLFSASLLATAFLLVPASEAQPKGKKRGKSEPFHSETVEEFVKKLMVFDKSRDGKLTKEEMIDKRLHGLLDRADTKKRGFVTRADLEALFTRENLDGGFGDFKSKRPKGPKSKVGPRDKGGPGGDKE